MYSEQLMEEAFCDIQGIVIESYNIITVNYPDNTVILAMHEELQYM